MRQRLTRQAFFLVELMYLTRTLLIDTSPRIAMPNAADLTKETMVPLYRETVLSSSTASNPFGRVLASGFSLS